MATGWGRSRSATGATSGGAAGAAAALVLAVLLSLPATAAAQTGAPEVRGVYVTSSPSKASETEFRPYEQGDHVDVQVLFSQAVTVTGAPRLALTIGSRTRHAAFRSVSGGNVFFRYEVMGGDRDADGISVAADALTLNGGAIRAGGVAAALGLGSHALGNQANHRVDGGWPTYGGVAQPAYAFTRGTRGSFTLPAAADANSWTTYALAAAPALPGGLSFDPATRVLSGAPEVGMAKTAYTLNVFHLAGLERRVLADSLTFTVTAAGTTPAVSGVSIASSPAGGTSYATGENIDVDVTFNYPVTVTGAPRLALRIGSATRQAAYRTHGGSKVSFRYPVAAADVDRDGISIAAGALTLNGGGIEASNVAAALGLGSHAISNDSGHQVNDPQPSFGTATVADRHWTAGTAASLQLPQATGGDGTVSYALTGPGAVTSLSLPQGVVWTAATRTISGTPGAAAAAASYAWTATDGDGDTARLAFDVTVAAANAPKPMGLTFFTQPGFDGDYVAGERITPIIQFNQLVTVTGSPQLEIDVGGAVRTVPCHSSCREGDVNVLSFQYTVTSSDFDGDGISIRAGALSLNGGTVVGADAAAVPASLAIAAYAKINAAGHTVRDTQPSFSRTAGAAARTLAKDAATATTLPAAKDGDGALTYTISPALPAGLALGSARPTITGTPTAVGATTHTLTATDADGDQATLGPFTITVVDGAPVISDVTIVSKPYANGAYGLKELIRVTVKFDRPINGGNLFNSKLVLDVGGTTREARRDGFHGGGILYKYAVQAADRDADGISIGTDALVLNGAAITDSATGVAASTVLGTHAITNAAAHKVDGSVATPLAVGAVSIISTPAGSDGYDVGEEIDLRVTFSRPVRINGSPRLALNIGDDTRQASASTFNGGSEWGGLGFSYTVTANDRDSDGISVGASALTLNGATIRDADGADAALALGAHAITNASAHKVYTPARITGVTISSNPGANGAYDVGETIDVDLSWSQRVVHSGNGGWPRLALTIGANTRQVPWNQAAYGVAPYRYSYTVTASDWDGDGISIGADALTLPAGSHLKGNGNVAAVLSLGTHAITDDSGHTVRDGKPAFGTVAARPYLRNVAVSDELPEATGGDAPVTYALTGPGTAATLSLPVGLSWEADTRTLSGAPQSETAAASYTLTVTDTDGDTATAAFDLSVVTDPFVTGLTITSGPASGDTYAAGETITAEVTFDQALTVTGAPQLALSVGDATRQAAGSHVTGESKLSFSYTLGTSDRAADGISIAAGALTLNGATVRNAKGEDARLGLGANALAAQAGHKVSAPPKITGVDLHSNRLRCCWGVQPDGWEDSRQTDHNRYPPSVVYVEVTFDQTVAVTGTPYVALGIGSATRQAVYDPFLSRILANRAHQPGNVSVAGFYYELQPGDHDGDGVSVAADALTLGSGEIRDAEGEDAVIGLGSHAISNDPDLRVADTAPSFAASAGSTRRYLLNLRANDRLPAATGGDGTVTYALTGPGAGTTLSLPAGLAWSAATQTISGTPTTAATAASYTLTATDADGDAAAVTLSFEVVTDPVVTDVAITSNPASGDAYAAGETITVDVTFDQALTVEGTPNLALTIGSEARTAAGSHLPGQSTITFSYAVAANDRDANGISIAGGALALNGGTIRNAKDEDARLGLGAHAVVGAAGHKVSAPPRVAEVKLDTTELACCWSSQQSGWADPRQTATNRFAPAVVIAAVTFDQALVFGGSGTPSLALTIGARTRPAAYDGYVSQRMARSTGRDATRVLAFQYTLTSADFDGDGISIAAGALTLPPGMTMRGREGEAAVLGLGAHAITNDPAYRVRDTAPSFGTATIQPQHWLARIAGSLTLPAATGDGAISYALTPAQRPSWLAFDGATRVLSGTPLGSVPRTIWTWTATDGDGDATALTFPLTVASARAPRVLDVKFLSTPAAHSMYPPGAMIKAGVKFDKGVTVTGVPTLTLDVGGAARQAAYAGTQNGYLAFDYTVLQEDYDTDGVSIGSGALAHPATGNGGIFDAADGATRVALGLGSHAITNAGGHQVGSPPRVTGVSLQSTPQQAGTYTRGATITVQVAFDQTVTVTGAPRLALTVGGQTRQASAAAGAGNAYIRFSYTVVAADADADGLGVAAGALTLNGATIRDADGQDAVLDLGSHARSAFTNAKMDGSRTGLWPVFGAAAGPDLSLTVGTAATHALPGATGGDGTLRYAVSPALPAGLGVNAATGVLSGTPGMESPRTAYTLTATDSHGDAATLVFHLKAAGARPVVSGVTVASTPLSGDTYGASEEIRVDVTFHRGGAGAGRVGTDAMMVRGAPRLALDVGGRARQATFLSVSGATLRFRYTAQAEDRDSDGIAVAANALNLNGGLIRDAAGNNAILGLGSHALGAQGSHKVDGSAGRAPAVTGVRVTSAPASGDTYSYGETIEAEVLFDQAVGVSGTPNLALTLGTAAAPAAWNRAGTSPTKQIFRRVVAAADVDPDGLSIAVGALTLNGGTIRNVAGTNAALGLGSHALGNQASHKVNGANAAAPAVTGVAIRSFQSDGWYDQGQIIEARVTFSKALTVTKATVRGQDFWPELTLTIGSTARKASYHASSGRTIDFRYTVQDPDHDPDGLSIGARALNSHGAITYDVGAGADRVLSGVVDLGRHALGNQTSHKVDGRAATVTGVTINTTPANSAGYGAGETIRVQVNFSDIVDKWSGSSRLALTIGDNTRHASLSHSIGPRHFRTLYYEYTVQSTDRDADGISIAAGALTGNLRRREGNPVNFALGSHALGAQAAHKVTGAIVTPRVTGVSVIFVPRSNQTFTLGEEIQVRVRFDVPIVGSGGSPRLALAIGNATHRPSGQVLTATRELQFSHTVGPSDRDADGISIAAGALTLPAGATLRSRLGAAAALGLGSQAMTNDARFKVDGSLNPAAAGEVKLSGSARHDTFLTGERFKIFVEYDKTVTVTGTPTLALQVGSVTRRLPLSNNVGRPLSSYSGRALTFYYTVRHGDRDPDGISIAADALRPEGASITGPGGKAAQLRFTNSIVNDGMFRVGGAARPTPTFGAAVVPARVWTVGVPVDFTLPPATDGDGTLTYALTGPGTSAATLSLPRGLTYSATSTGAFGGGRISGTPAVDANPATYRLTATDTDGDTATLDFTIRVLPDLTPRFEATVDDREWIEDAAIDAFDLPAAVSGNGTLTYTLSPALPGGVSRADRRVSGAPDAAAARTEYTWTATDADGDEGSLTFHVTVADDTAPSFGGATIDDQAWKQGSQITAVILPEATGGNGPLTHVLRQEGLPAGVELDGRVLQGTPTATWESVEYTWRATDQDGDRAELTFDLEVYADLLPSFGDATLDDRTWIERQAITAFTLPEATGGDGDLTYALTPALPAGVSRDAATREVSGTPSATLAATVYTWTATDADGDRAELSFTAAVDGIPTFGDRTIAEAEWVKGVAIAAFTLPEVTGGDGRVTYALTADAPHTGLPAGVLRDAATHEVTGTPTATRTRTEYTWTATDTDGDEASLSFHAAVVEPPVVTLVLSPAAIDEHDGTNPGSAAVTVTLDKASRADVTVTVAAAAGTNAAAGDYALSNAVTLTIAAGETTSTGTVTVTAVDNTADAPDKEVTVSATVSGNSGAADPASVTLTIRDDEAAPAVTLAVADGAVAEDGGTTTVTATLSHASSAATTVTVTGVEGAYTVDSSAATITIAAGETENVADTVTITAVNDAVDNVGDRVVTVTGTAANAQAAADSETVAVTGAALTLTDDEDTPAVTLALSAAAIDEHDGTNPGSATVTATLDRASSEVVTLTVAAAAGANAEDGGASPPGAQTPTDGPGEGTSTGAVTGASADGRDFTLSSARTLTIAAGETTSTGTVTVTAVDDTVDAPDKEVTVSAAVSGDSGVADPSSVTLTIEDDEAAPAVTLAVADSAIAEDGGATTVTATLSHASSAATTVTVAGVEGAYTVDSSDTTITIAAGETANAADTVTITAVNDAVDNVGDRAVTVTGTAANAQAAAESATMAVTGAALTLTDDEDTPAVTLALSAAAIDEHDGTNPGSATVTATLDGVSSEAVTLIVAAAAGTNAEDGDFTLSIANTLTIAAGETSSTGTVTVTAVDDTMDAPDKQVTVSATVSGDSGVADPASVTLTIEDDEATPAVALAVADASISENGGTTTVTATLSHASSAATTITVEPEAGAYTVGADATITIAAGETENATDSVTITAVDDAIDNVGDRAVTVTGTAANAQAAADSATVAVTGAALTLTDDEDTPEATLALSDATIDEHDGTNPGASTVTATLNRASTEAVTLTVAATAGTNAADGDFSLSSGKTLTIAAGHTSSTGTVTVTAVDNTADGPDKEVTVSATVSGDSGVTDPSSVTLTIEDDEAAPTVALAVTDASISENGGATTVTATLSHASSAATTITVEPEAGAYTVGADATITIAAGETENATDSVTITAVDDAIDNVGDRAVTVTGTAANAQAAADSATVAVTGAALTLTDDEDTPEATLALSDATIDEHDGTNAGSSTVTATLNRASSEAVTLTVAAAAGTNAADGDFSLSSGKTLTIAAGHTSSTGAVTVTAVDNTADAPDKQVTVSATVSGDSGVADPTSVTLTIEDDEAAPTVALAVTDASISENGGATTVTATLSHASSAATTITVSAAAGPHTVAADFKQTGTALSIAAGDTASTGTVTIAAVDDDEDAAHDKTVRVTGSAQNSHGVGAVTGVSVTLTDDDVNKVPSFGTVIDDQEWPVATEIARFDLPQATGGDGALTYAMTPALPSWLTRNGFAVTGTTPALPVAGRDYTWTARDTDGDVAELTFQIAVSETTVDPEGGMLSLAISSPRVTEGAAGATASLSYEVTLSAASTEQVTVKYADAGTGTAASGTDYAALSAGTLTFEPGDTNKTVTVTVTGDGVDEPNETVKVSLSLPVNANVPVSGGTGTGTIEDDDATPAVTLAVADSAIAENGGTTTVTATLSHESSAATTITVQPEAGAYTVGADATITIAAGATSNATDTAAITAVNDAIDNVGDRAVTVTGTAANAQAAADSATVAVIGAALTLTDDEDTPEATLALSPSAIDEHDGTNPGSSTVTATLNRASSEAVTLTVAAAAGTNAAAGDFSLSSAKTLTIAAGDTTSTGTVTVAAVDNTVDAPDKQVTVSATVSGNSGVAVPSVVTLTIEDDEAAPTVALALADSAISENGGATTVIATLSHASSAATTITVTAVSGAYTVGSDATITVAAGQTSNAADSVTITAVDDAIDNVVDRAVTVTGTAANAQAAADSATVSVTGAALTLTDDEDPPEATLAPSPATVDEHDGTNPGSATVTATLNRASSEAVTLTVAAAAGTNAASGDFSLSSAKTLTIAAGETSSTGTVTVTAVDNTADAPDKEVTVSAVVSGNSGVAAPSAVTLTIQDDEAAPTVALALADSAISENGGATTVTATLSHASSAATTITVQPEAGAYTVGADATITIAAGETENAADNVTITAVDDAIDNVVNRTATVTGTAQNSHDVGTVTGASLTLTDDEGAPTATLALSPAAIDEHDGTNPGSATVTATLNRASTEAVTLTVAATAGTNAAATDFSLSAAKTLTIAAGDTSSTGTVTVTAVDNAADGPDKQVSISASVSGDSGVATPASVTLTIEDDEAAPTVALAVADSAISENGGATTVTATLSHASSAATTVTVTSVSGAYTVGADATITIAAGETANATDNVTITAVDDAIDNVGNRAVMVTGTAANAQAAADSATVTVIGAALTLTDDEDTPEATLALSPATIDEHDGTNAGSSTVTATLNRASTEAVTLTVAATAGTNAADSDFSLSSAKTLTIAAGHTSSTGPVTVTAVDNTADAPDKEVTVSAVASGNSGVAAPSNVTLTIEDDEAEPTVALAVSDASISENGGATTVTATLSHASSAATTITVSAAAGPHTVAADFKQTGTALSIAAGDTASTGTVTIAAVDDDQDAAHDKTVRVTGSAQNSHGVGTVTAASLTLTDDDVNKVPSFGTVIDDQEWPVATEIARLDLPQATGGDGALTYAMTPALPSWLTRNGFAVTGTTPALPVAGRDYTWTARDTDGDVAELTFQIAVSETTADPEGGMLSLAISSPRVTEGAAGATASLSYEVTLSAASTEQVTVKYADAGTGTAASGTDYAALSAGTLTFAPGDTSKTVTVTVTGDGVDEPNETVKVSLSLPVNANVPVSGGTGTGTIEDDDATPAVTLAVADSAIAENGGTTTVTATLSHESSAATTITVQPEAGAYTVGADATITIAAGETANASDTVTVTVTAVDDAVATWATARPP